MMRAYGVSGISSDDDRICTEAVLMAVVGVRLVEVDVKARIVRVAGVFRDWEIRTALTGAGYEVTNIGECSH